jgi:hypothetical protein
VDASDLKLAVANAERRLGRRHRNLSRRPRSDAGRSRLPGAIAEVLTDLLYGQERPPMHDIQAEVAGVCARLGERTPARATIYRFMTQCPPRQYHITDLPEPVRRCLYNLGEAGDVPGHQVVFYAFHYGDIAAMSFAAGLPWLDLYQADHMRGWRPRSHGLLRAVLRRRGV